MRCKSCKEKFEVKYFNQKFCMEKDECIQDFLSVTVEKKKKEEAKKWRAKKLILKESIKTLSEYKNDLQKEINTIIRLIDKGWACIATGSSEGKMNAGHYLSVGSSDTTRFHLENIWLQSEHSNSWKAGDTIRYQEGIEMLYGKDYLDYLTGLKNYPLIKLGKEDIKEKISIARNIVRELKKVDKQYSLEERVELRKRFNKEIGIYL